MPLVLHPEPEAATQRALRACLSWCVATNSGETTMCTSQCMNETRGGQGTALRHVFMPDEGAVVEHGEGCALH